MKGKRSENLRAHRRALGLEDQSGEAAPSESLLRYQKKYPLLKDLPGSVIREAWFARAHLLLRPGARIGVIGCGDGELAYALAVMNPDMHLVGVDSDRKAIARAKASFDLPNLEFHAGDMAKNTGLEPESLDAIVNSYILHEIYSSSRYNDRQVARTIEYHLSLLKYDGMMYIRDYALHYTGEYVLMEMPEGAGGEKDIEKMSETELLVWYAGRARSRENPGCHGFFLEEQPPRFPGTRLFRIPYKWAYEFIVRKDDRSDMQAGLHKEYTYFTEKEFTKTLRSLGARVLYSSPHWSDSVVTERFEGRFRLYDENHRPLETPPTSFIAVVQKKGERKSLNLQERRPALQPNNRLRVTAMRNDRTGRLVDIVTRDVDLTEVIPYRIAADGQLNVFVHGGLPRGIVNAVHRNGKDLDGKRWSGHMVEAIAIPTGPVLEAAAGELKDTVLFSRDYLGLKPVQNARLEEGHAYYPAPDSVDELIRTRYLQVAAHEGLIEPRAVTDDVMGFTTNGRIREVSAQRLLDSIAAGFIPNARLEMQILALFDRLGMEAEVWDECPLSLEESEVDNLFDLDNYAKLAAEDDSSFKQVRGTAGQLRSVQSIFVDEGWVEGGISGLASRDMEFVISEENTMNKAVVMPLTKKAGDIMVGVEVDYLPVPQRHEGNGLSIMVPGVNLPRDVTNIYQARKYIADMYKVKVENVWRLGESYFCHSAVTPQRIFPFAVAVSGTAEKPTGGPFQFAPVSGLWNIMFRVWDHKHDTWFMTQLMRVYRRFSMSGDISLQVGRGKEMMKPKTSPLIQQISIAGGGGGGGGGRKKGAGAPSSAYAAPAAPPPSFQNITRKAPPPVAEQDAGPPAEPADKQTVAEAKKKLHIK